MERVAEHAGLSLATIYRYYSNIDALRDDAAELDEMRRDDAAVAALLAAFEAEPDPRERLRSALRQVFAAIQARAAIWRLMLARRHEAALRGGPDNALAPPQSSLPVAVLKAALVPLAPTLAARPGAG